MLVAIFLVFITIPLVFFSGSKTACTASSAQPVITPPVLTKKNKVKFATLVKKRTFDKNTGTTLGDVVTTLNQNATL